MRINSLLFGFFLALVGGGHAVASTGQIKVEVSNAPGEINLDGMPTDQKAPATIEFVSPGEHLVELHYGCLKGSQNVVVKASKMTTTRLRMRTVKGSGTLRLRGLPPMAQVFVDDAPVSQANKGIGMPCGGHRIRAEAEGFADWQEMVVITTDRWSTTTVHMVEVAIESAPRPLERARLEVDEEFDEDLDDWEVLDAIEEDREGNLLARERELEERERRLREEEAARRSSAAETRRRDEAARRKSTESARRSRYGDVDSLDDEDPEEDFEEDPDEEDEEDPDEEEEEEELFDDDLDAPQASPSRGSKPSKRGSKPSKRGSKPSKRDRNAKSGNTATVLGLSTASAGVAGLIFGVVAHNQFKGHQDHWAWIAANSGGPAGQAAMNYGEQSLQPAKERRNTALGIGSALLFAGSGLSAYAQLQNGESTPQRRESTDRIDDLDAFGIRFSGQW
jgi:hypothetical protein